MYSKEPKIIYKCSVKVHKKIINLILKLIYFLILLEFDLIL